MPLFNLFKNCFYYWMFTAYVAYHINHPLYTAPCFAQIYLGLASFLVSNVINSTLFLIGFEYKKRRYSSVEVLNSIPLLGCNT